MPSEASNVSIRPEIGYRFAGYVDGEGHFAITRRQKSTAKQPNYQCSFALHIRDDDRHVLEAFQHELGGIGHMYEVGARHKPGQTNTKPTAMWTVNRKSECLLLVSIFEEYRLWSKKAGDFHIWAKAVRYKHGPQTEGLAPLERWFNEIRANRQYDESVVVPSEIETDWLALWEDELDA